jgi:uncharacterized protein (TIGR02599 family)
MTKDPPQSRRQGFSLLELLVAMTLLLLVVGLSAGILSATQDVWKRVSSQTEQQRGARQSLDTVSRRISQAVLNPYWSVVYDNTTGQPRRFERASELRFLVSPGASIVSTAADAGTAIFFQSPTGYFSDGSGELGSALNTWGYFIEYGSDQSYRPDFLTSAGVPEQNRFRLIEFLDPSDNLEVFRRTSAKPDYVGREWFTTPLTLPPRKRILAENVLAFVVLPRLSSLEDPSGIALASNYAYDTTARNPDKRFNPRNQLPPVVEIAAVVLDSRSISKISWGTSPPDLGIAMSSLFKNPARLDEDLEALRLALQEKNLEARIFRQTIPIPSARWSTEQQD